MLFPEEESVSNVVEKGTFYTPTAETEFDEKPLLQKTILKIVTGILLALVLPRLMPQLTLTHFLASIILLMGLYPLMTEDKAFKICFALSMIQLLWSVWSYLCANIIQDIPLPKTIASILPYIVLVVDLGIISSFWLGMKQLHPATASFTLIACIACAVFMVLCIPASGTILLIAKICAAVICCAALVITAVKVR